jgi:hypothetical protein
LNHEVLRPTDAAEDRQTELKQLYFQNYAAILDSALEERRLLHEDGCRIAQGLSAHLGEYDGALDTEAFLAWANSIAKPAAQRLSRFYEIIRDNDWAVQAGIRSALGIGKNAPNHFEDDAATAEELANEVRWLAFQYLDHLIEAGPAKISTRLFALARVHAGFHTKKIRLRYHAVCRRLASGQGFLGFTDAEVLTDAQLESLKIEEAEDQESMD